ncbi:bacteriochlorophyll 4-vinyl reductase [Ectothiorhodospira mobilis]|uniref:bacteriochlorophyll 4-vinyl reductase n=1 Tax=Ectothiorhodospira mobilis TaxID=195064 RepID=UPI001906DDB1|nr:bacteriochlorophyll 4-vinyl reductase [Ectothiorhodospira mobilis]MBK1691038.1 bacteriochlorophyll 4-vinyl reductase [Ectothiorhodospira mobilis]
MTHNQTNPSGTIGPNAITRIAQALRHQHSETLTQQVFESAGLTEALLEPPTEMVDEDWVSALHQALHQHLDPERAREVSLEAGRLTGDYLLAHRIPKPVQRLLKWLPAGPASRILLTAIQRNAWTFTGSGSLEVRHRPQLELTLTHTPIPRRLQGERPVCHYYAASFERLFQVLVHPDTRVTEVQCTATGAPACVFHVRWRS